MSEVSSSPAVHPRARRRATFVLALILLPILAVGLSLSRPAPVLAACGSVTVVTTETELNAAITDFNSQAPVCTYEILFGADITLTADMVTINNSDPLNSLTIDGNGHTLDGDNENYDNFSIDSSVVEVYDLTMNAMDDGIYIENNATVTVSLSTFTGAWGYMISVSNSDLTVNDTTMGDDDDYNGGISASFSTVTADQLTIGKNGYAGIFMEGGDLTLIRSDIGGLIDPGVSLYNGAIAIVMDTAIHDNGGSAITAYDGSTLTIINSTIADNGYEGVAAIDSDLTMTNVTVSGNYQGVRLGVSAGTRDAVINNSILANSDDAEYDCFVESYGGVLNLGINYTLIEDTDSNACGLAAANPDGDGNIVGEAPLLAGLGNYGGPTPTMPLIDLSGNPTATSPAIDSGSNALAVDENNAALAYDQRGTPYVRIIGGTVNMGAVEEVLNITCALPATVFNETELAGAIICYNAVTTPGSYTITLGADIDLTQATPAIDNTTAGVTLVIEGDNYTIDGQDILGVRPITIAESSFVTLNNATVTGGNESNLLADDGGGIFIDDYATVVLNNVTVTGNIADDEGGGIFIDDNATLTLNDSTVSDNQTEDNGGGIFAVEDSTLVLNRVIVSGNLARTNDGGGINTDSGSTTTINDSSIINNVAGEYGVDDSPGDGGGIDNDGLMTITNSVISGNTAEGQSGIHGGGIYNEGRLILLDCTVDNNKIRGTEGDFYGGGIDSEAGLFILNSTISNNRLEGENGQTDFLGGGIYFSTDFFTAVEDGYGADLVIINSTISGNSAVGGDYVFGGAIYAIDDDFDSHLHIINSTISDNSVASNGDPAGTNVGGGGVYLDGYNSDDHNLDAVFDNTILANSSTAGVTGVGGQDCVLTNDATLDSNFSLYEDSGAGACNVTNAADGNLTGSDPVLGALANNGGPTETHLPLGGSPAIDSGDNALALDPTNPLTADQRGYTPRIVNIVERGSVEIDAQAPVGGGFCPANNEDVGYFMTDLIGTGQGSLTKGYRTRKLVLPNYEDAASLFGQLAAVDIGQMKYIRFLYPNGTKVQIYDPTSPAYRPYAVDWWGSELTPSKYIKGQFFWGTKANKAPRAFVLWPTYNTEEQYANVFVKFDESVENHVAWEAGFISTQTQVIPIPETQADGATVVVRLAIVDNNKDTRPIWLSVTVDEQSQGNTDTVPNMKDTLNLYEFTFENVPAGVDEVTIRLESPPPGELALLGGDSAAIIGAAVNYACGGDAPQVEPGSITIIKDVTPQGEYDDWLFTGSLGPFSLPGNGGQQTFSNLTPGAFAITEKFPDEDGPYWYTTVECDSGESSANNQIAVILDPGEDITCTFTNTILD